MEITVAREYDFVPEWNENKKDSNPIRFHMRYLGTGEREKMLKYEFGADGAVKIVPDKPALFMAAVLRIENLVVNKEPVGQARDVMQKPGLDFLFLEVVANVIAQNAKEEPKN